MQRLTSISGLASWSLAVLRCCMTVRGMQATRMRTVVQGLTLIHFSAQREHFLSHVLGGLAGFSDENDSG